MYVVNIKIHVSNEWMVLSYVIWIINLSRKLKNKTDVTR